MIKAAMEWLRENSKTREVKVGDRLYDHRGVILVTEPMPQVLDVKNLTSLVAYCLGGQDGVDWEQHGFIHIASPEIVRIYGALRGVDSKRPLYVAAHRDPGNTFVFDTWLDPDIFLTGLMSKFESTADLEALIKVVSNIDGSDVTNSADDGRTQTVTVRTGVTMREAQELPTRLKLMPYRTFIEASQPASHFILRVQKSRHKNEDGSHRLELKLLECDGGAWENVATANIKWYLEKELPDWHILI